jgi:hypothetical protein
MSERLPFGSLGDVVQKAIAEHVLGVLWPGPVLSIDD